MDNSAERKPQLPERELPQKGLPERDPELKSDKQARLDELGDDPAEVGPDSAGQSGGSEGAVGYLGSQQRKRRGTGWFRAGARK